MLASTQPNYDTARNYGMELDLLDCTVMVAEYARDKVQASMLLRPYEFVFFGRRFEGVNYETREQIIK